MLFYIPNVCYVSDMTLLIDGNNRLKPRREHLGISRKALSVCTGIPLRSIQYYEEEKEQRLSFEEIEKLSKCLKMDTFQLLKEFPREIEYKTKDINNGNDLARLLLLKNFNDFVCIDFPSSFQDEENIKKLWRSCIEIACHYEGYQTIKEEEILKLRLVAKRLTDSLLRTFEAPSYDYEEKESSILLKYYEAIKLNYNYDNDIFTWKTEIHIISFSKDSSFETSNWSDTVLKHHFRNDDWISENEEEFFQKALLERPKIPGI